MKKHLLLSTIMSLALSASASDTETIYVYGSLVNKDLYDDSNSLSIKTEEDFSNHQSEHMEDLIKAIPNVNISMGNSRGKYFQVRGIGERAAYEGMPNHSVGFVLDDIDYSGISGVSGLNGISQVEVYKGPQATRLGPSALAGMVHMTSIEPSKDFQGKASATVGNFNTFEEAISISGPLSKKYQASLSVSKRDSDGHMSNTYLNREDTNGHDEFGLKAKILGLYDGLKAKLTLHFFELNNGYDAFTQNNSNRTTSDKPGRDDQQTIAQALRLEKNLKNNWMSYSILTHSNTKIHYSYDEDWGNDVQWNALPGYNADYDYDIAFPRTREDFSIDQRFVKDNKLVLGIYAKYSDEKFQEIGTNNEAIRKNIRGEFDTKNIALYFENESPLKDKFSLSYGLRVENRDAEYSDTLNNKFNPNETMVGGKISLNYKKSDTELTYLKLSRGYKAGGFNTQSGVPVERKEFKQESLYSLELGNKKLWDSYNLETKASIFVMYREDVQVKTSFQDDPMDPSSYTFYNDNATDGYNYGAEFEFDWMATTRLDITSSLALLESKYGSYSYGATNLKNREMPHAPEYQFNAMAKYSFDSGIYMSTNLFMSDDFYFSNSHSEKSNAHQLVDIKLGYKKKSFDISFWSKNIFNEYYAQRGFYFSNMPPAWAEERYTQRGTPRTYGVSLKYKF